MIFFNFFKQIFWILNDKCSSCGGDIDIHINGKWYCDDCGKRN